MDEPCDGGNAVADRTCSVDGCDRSDKIAKGLCMPHYAKARRAEVLPPRPTAEARFWSKVDKGEHPQGCWTWTGYLTDGYGQFWVGYQPHRAHRFAYELMRGPIPDGLHVDHLCRNRACVNPDHMEPVTPAENSRRMHAALGHTLHPASPSLPNCRHVGCDKRALWASRQLCRSHGVALGFIKGRR